jgi:hypothetical protein
MLVTERLRQRASSRGGFSVPAMEERQVPENIDPILASSMRGVFLQVRRGLGGVARFGFFACPPSDENLVLERLYDTVLGKAEANGWPTLFGSIPEALSGMRVNGVAPKTIVIPVLHTMSEGDTASVQGLQVVTGSLPQGCALVAASPAALGVYTRVGDHLGLQLYSVSKTLMVVRPNGSLG